jgi:hypothetical protein
MTVGLSQIFSSSSFQRLSLCSVLLLGLLAVSLAAPVDPENRGKAYVGVVADLASPTLVDQVNIHIVNNKDQQLLTRIAQTLGSKLKGTPTKFKFVTGDPAFVNDPGIGLDFSLPVVPRGESYLPIAPFIEAFAPYVSHLDIMYFIRGQFVYKGYQSFEQKDVIFKVSLPDVSSQQTDEPLAIYGVNVIIKNPSLTTVPVSNYPTAGTRRGFGTLLWGLIIGIAVMAVGIALALVLSRWQASVASGDKKA